MRHKIKTMANHLPHHHNLRLAHLQILHLRLQHHHQLEYLQLLRILPLHLDTIHQLLFILSRRLAQTLRLTVKDFLIRQEEQMPNHHLAPWLHLGCLIFFSHLLGHFPFRSRSHQIDTIGSHKGLLLRVCLLGMWCHWVRLLRHLFPLSLWLNRFRLWCPSQVLLETLHWQTSLHF